MHGNLTGELKGSKKEDKATFYSPSEEWFVRAASTIKLEEREFVVDSRASMHKFSKRELTCAELETMRISKKPTTVMTANGEVQTREEASEHVKELDFFVTDMLLEETPAVLSLGKLCEDHGCTDHWASGRKPQLTKKARKLIACCQFMCHALSLVYRRVSLHHPH